jgi:glycosyltransferase involved in cell wall biosynthesis
MRICHLTSVHRADDTRIARKEAAALAAAGHEVHLVAPHAGAFSIPGVELHPVPVPADRRERLRRTRREVIAAGAALQADVYHFHDIELLSSALRLQERGARVIYDVHEDVVKDLLHKRWVPLPLRLPLAGYAWALQRWSRGRFDAIVTATPAIARRFPAERTTVVQNFPWRNELRAPAGAAYGTRPPTVVYIGGLQPMRGIPEMVEGVGRARSAGVRLILGGEFSDAGLATRARALPGWERADHRGWLGRDAVATALGEARAGLVVFQPAPNHIEAQPNKLFEYMSAGLPVIASHFPLWREIVDGVGCGLCVDPTDPTAIAGAIDWVLTHPDEAEAMGRRGREAVETRFNWEAESQKLLGLYRRLGEGR